MSKEEQTFLQFLSEKPDNHSLRLVFADFLEERGDPRGELLRLTHTLTQTISLPNRLEMEARLWSLLQLRVKAIGPFYANCLGMRFAWIPSGTFLMGSKKQDDQSFHHVTLSNGEKVTGDPPEMRECDTDPMHQVTFTNGYYMGVGPVTQGQWDAVMGESYRSRGFLVRNDEPACETWYRCEEFVEKLRALDKKPYRLPTEAEWEYASRAGTSFHVVNGRSSLEQSFWDQEMQLLPENALPENAWVNRNATVKPRIREFEIKISGSETNRYFSSRTPKTLSRNRERGALCQMCGNPVEIAT